VNIQAILMSTNWQSDDNKMMMFRDERYYVFSDKDTLFDHGHIEYDHENKIIKLRSAEAWGVLNVVQYGEKVDFSGQLYSSIAGEIRTNTLLSPCTAELNLSPVTNIQSAGYRGDVATIKSFLADGASINEQNERGATAIYQACMCVSLQVIDFLIENNADINICDKKGYSPLHKAIKSDNVQAVKRLLEAKAILNQGNSLNQGDSLNQDESEKHVIFYAVNNNASLEIIKLLFFYLEKQPNYLTLLNDNAYQIFREAEIDYKYGVFSGKENPQLIRFLLETGIDFEKASPFDGYTPFLLAVSHGSIETVKEFINHGVNVFAKTKDDQTALDLICESAEDEFVKYAKEIELLLNKAGLINETEEDAFDLSEEPVIQSITETELPKEPNNNDKDAVTFYTFEDDFDAYDDCGDLDSSPDFLEDIELYEGDSIRAELEEPLHFYMDEDFGNDPQVMWGFPLICMRDDLVQTLLDEGAENIETFETVIHNPMTKTEHLNYKAINILGRHDSDELTDDIVITCGGYSCDPIVNERVKNILQQKFPTLIFNED